MRRNPLPTYERLHEVLSYDPERGVLFWKIERGGTKIGDVAGYYGDGRYVRINVDKQSYRAHLVAWKMMTGLDSTSPIDHINGIKSDNRWANLRAATKSLNQANVGLIASNSSGSKGVRWYKAYQKWAVQFTKDGKCHFVGYFDDFEEAKSAFAKRYREVYGEFARVK